EIAAFVCLVLFCIGFLRRYQCEIFREVFFYELRRVVIAELDRVIDLLPAKPASKFERYSVSHLRCRSILNVKTKTFPEHVYASRCSCWSSSNVGNRLKSCGYLPDGLRES